MKIYKYELPQPGALKEIAIPKPGKFLRAAMH